MCSFKDSTTAIHHFKLNAERTAVVSHTILTDTVTHQRLKCRTDLLPGPDGALYFSEGGGWLNGPIKRLIRRSSFATTSVSPQFTRPVSGALLNYSINLRHSGSITNTFALTIDVPATLAYIDTAHAAEGTLTADSFQLRWSGSISPGETWTGTYQLSLASLPDPYVLKNAVRLTAPGATTVILTPTVIVNAHVTFLPLTLRSP